MLTSTLFYFSFYFDLTWLVVTRLDFALLYFTFTLVYSTLLHSTLLYSSLLYSTLLLYSALLLSALLYSTLLCFALLYSYFTFTITCASPVAFTYVLLFLA